MFLLLVFVCILHQTHATLSVKVDQYPLRPVALRLIETTGRLAIFPAVTGIYVSTAQEISPGFNITMILIVTVAGAAIFIREFFGIRALQKKALFSLLDKVNGPELQLDQLTTAEVIVFNAWKFHILSNSPLHIAKALNEQQSIAPPTSETVKLRNLQLLHDLVNEKSTPAAAKRRPSPGSSISSVHLSMRKRTESIGENGGDIPMSVFGGERSSPQDRRRSRSNGSFSDINPMFLARSSSPTTSSRQNSIRGLSESLGIADALSASQHDNNNSTHFTNTTSSNISQASVATASNSSDVKIAALRKPPLPPTSSSGKNPPSSISLPAEFRPSLSNDGPDSDDEVD